MINKFIKYLQHHRARQRITLALARAAATSKLRNIDPLNPSSWEFCGFSQNGEDGIIDFLTGRINNPNRNFLEIGASDGIENNTAWLAIANKYSGIMVEGDGKRSTLAKEIMAEFNIGVQCVNIFINKDNVSLLAKIINYDNPDVLSLDIDGNDYYIAKALMEMGFRPKIFIVEYNSAYGPFQSLTIKYTENFNIYKAHKSHLYYGVSVTGWKHFFDYYGYKFITVDYNGVNAFFVDANEFDYNFINTLKGIDFQENCYQMMKFKAKWEDQFNMISEMEFVDIK
jgi:hypothetical protein